MYGKFMWKIESMTSQFRRRVVALLTWEYLSRLSVALALLSIAPFQPAFGAESIPTCEVEKTKQDLTQAERDAIQESNEKLDVLTSEYLLRWGPPSKPPVLPQRAPATEIDFPQARRLILNGLVTTILQTHSLDVWIVSTSGKTYQTRETILDEVVHIARMVDPCGRFINLSSE
jgi:hypothetical protein